MMNWYHDGLGWGGWLVMAMAMIAFWALVVVAVVTLFRTAPPARTPEQVLDERFARGELDVDEYRLRRAALHQPGSGRRSLR